MRPRSVRMGDPYRASLRSRSNKVVMSLSSSVPASKGARGARPFRYFDRGTMAVVGRNFALLEAPHLRLSGYLTWLLWGAVHLIFLPQLQSRLRVAVQWLWWSATDQRSSLLIAEGRREAPVGAGISGASSIQPSLSARKTAT